MRNPSSIPLPDAERGKVLGKAAVRAAAELGLTRAELAEIIGTSAPSVSRMADGRFALSGKPFQLAACLVRVFRSLDAIAGGDPASIRGWIDNRNTDLGDRPRALMKQAAGLVDVMNYLDARRAPL